MDRYAEIRAGLVSLAQKQEDIEALIVVGSQARQREAADEYSDLDVILATRQPEEYLDGEERLSAVLGAPKISFVEQTMGGAREKRMLLAGAKDVDLILLTPDELRGALQCGVLDGILARGYAALYDGMGLETALRQAAGRSKPRAPMTLDQFHNEANDFWYHVIWAGKKIARGELWTAKMCVDAYLKHKLLGMMELYAQATRGAQQDVWHNGRLLERWMDERVVRQLGACFARYDDREVAAALRATAELYGELARAGAERLGYAYPAPAERCAMQWLAQREAAGEGPWRR